MVEPDYDCIIIGGSANGANAAISAAKSGLSVAIIEEHDPTGLPEHCSGLFSYWGLDRLDIYPPEEIIFNKTITGSRIVSPNGKVLTVRKGESHALVCDRAAFDRFLISKAEKLGAKLYQPFRAVDITRVNNDMEVKVKRKDTESIKLTAPIVISAEGIRGSISEKLGLKIPEKKTIVNAAQFYMYGLNEVDPNLVEVYQNREFATDFFGWLIPMSKDSAKIGLGTSQKAASKQLQKLIETHPVLKERCEGAEIRRTTAGRIPSNGPIKKTFTDNFLMVGDVAGQTKPTTGGGVIFGGIAAQIAGQVAAESIAAGDQSSKFLKRYQKRWKGEMSRNLKLMKLVRLYMNRLSDQEVNSFYQRLENKGILADIENYGHVDEQGKLVLRFMKTLSLYPFFLKTSPKLVKSIFRL